jgi:hypothetical protein
MNPPGPRVRECLWSGRSVLPGGPASAQWHTCTGVGAGVLMQALMPRRRALGIDVASMALQSSAWDRPSAQDRPLAQDRRPRIEPASMRTTDPVLRAGSPIWTGLDRPVSCRDRWPGNRHWALKVGMTGRIKARKRPLREQGVVRTRSVAGILKVSEAVPSGGPPAPRSGAEPDASRALKYLGTVGFSLLSHTGKRSAKWSKRRLCRLMAARAI